MPPPPRPTFLVEAWHQAAPNDHFDSGQRPGSLRLAATVSKNSEEVDIRAGLKDAVSDAIVGLDTQEETLVLQLGFADWGVCKLIWYCWVRNCPWIVPFLPQLVLTRTRRAMSFVLRLSAALLIAISLASATSWGPQVKDEVAAAQRSVSDLFAELSDAFSVPVVVPLGICSRVGAFLLAGVLSVPGPLKPDQAGQHEWIRWWRSSRSQMWRNCLGIVAGFIVYTVGSIVLAAMSPQPRSTVAAAIFISFLSIDGVLLPVLSALIEAWVLRRASRRDSTCYDSILQRCPELLDFSHAQVERWRSRRQLLSYAEALVIERQSCQATRTSRASASSCQSGTSGQLPLQATRTSHTSVSSQLPLQAARTYHASVSSRQSGTSGASGQLPLQAARTT